MKAKSQHSAKARPIELGSLRALGVPFVSLDEPLRTLGSCLVDGSTLIDSHVRLGWYASSGGRRLNRDQVPENEALLQFLQTIVICDQIYVDGSLVVINKRIEELVRGLPNVLIPIYVSPEERVDLVSHLENVNLDRLSVATKAFGPSTLRADLSEWRSFQHHFRGAGEKTPVSLPPFLADSTRSPIRIAYYFALSSHFALSYAPHPFRAPALAAVHGGMSLQGASQMVVDRFEREVLSSILTGGFQRRIASVRIPPIGERVLQESLHQGGTILETALTIRESKRGKRFREWCRELEEALAMGNAGSEVVQKKDKEVKRLFADWSSDVNEGVRYRTRTLSFGLGVGSFVTANLKSEPFTFKDRILWSKGSALLFLNDLLRSWRAHGLLTKLGRRDTDRLEHLAEGTLWSLMRHGFFEEPRKLRAIAAEARKINSRLDLGDVRDGLTTMTERGVFVESRRGWISHPNFSTDGSKSSTE